MMLTLNCYLLAMRKHLENKHPDIWHLEKQYKLEHKEKTVDALTGIDKIYLRDEELQKQLGDKQFPVVGYKIELPKKTRRQSATGGDQLKMT